MITFDLTARRVEFLVCVVGWYSLIPLHRHKRPRVRSHREGGRVKVSTTIRGADIAVCEDYGKLLVIVLQISVSEDDTEVTDHCLHLISV